MRGFSHRFRGSFVLWLTLMWCLLQGEVSWANIIGGALLGSLIVLALPLPPVPRTGNKVRVGRLLRFIVEWAGDLLTSSAKVAWLALRPQRPPRNAILRVPMRVQSELVFYLAACAYNLQPGGSVTDIDIANREWTIHVLDGETEADRERERKAVAKLERQMIAIYESKR
ncbi:putative monovalent cation/H+ antiporter subunit E [Corynebacterium capitovis DSM 44611]|uniref:Na+/H+ antiporter subunit E n=1 Tax=Corynebacterium capitovis TaxID=131081 RepID=UPI00036A9F56|nr:Na+/H+ antiporter subunit E [Corynebacterium capitovis]WKD58198.1 putative monovalent cation/H+ antiporter subunit E [Corynebacterium capitovis DSM 44611]